MVGGEGRVHKSFPRELPKLLLCNGARNLPNSDEGQKNLTTNVYNHIRYKVIIKSLQQQDTLSDRALRLDKFGFRALRLG